MDLETGLPSYPDNYFDLAIVDPPYGVGQHYNFRNQNLYENKRPEKEYFLELFRISKNQIIWGGNYFTNDLPENRGWILWDKVVTVPNGFSAFELAWTSFDMVCKKYQYCNNGGFVLSAKNANKTHPTQKPVELYEVLLADFSKPGQLILDTHVGSASSLIACESMGFDYVGFEIDPDYYAAAQNRMSKGIQAVLI